MKSHDTFSTSKTRRQPDPYTTYLSRRYSADREDFTGNEEPSLDEVLADPVVATMMSSDGVPHDRLMGLIHKARRSIDGF